MSPKTISATATRQLLWIVCGVALLTTLVIAVSWLASGSGGETTPAGQPPKITTTETAARPVFQPEMPAPGSQRGTQPAPQIAEEQPPVSTRAGQPSAPEQEAATPPSPSEQPSPAPVPEASPETALAETSAAPAAAASAPDHSSQTGYGVQLGAFGEEANARDLASRLKAQGYKTTLAPKGKVTRVIVTGPKTRAEAEALRDALKKKGFPQAAVVTLP